MIQRIQTIWFLIASACAFATLKLSFYSGHTIALPTQFTYVTGIYTIPIVILTVAIAVTSLVLIFLFKDRKMQMRITLATIALSVLSIVLYFMQTRNFIPTESSFDLTSVFVFAIPVFLILACNGIYKDEKLIKDSDRLR